MAKKKSSADKAYEFILEEISNNILMPGEPVIEQEIADQIKISRTPVREAMKRLETEGLLVSLPYQGTIVAMLSVEDIQEICRLRSMIELWALKQGFYLITDAEINQVERMFNEAVHPFCPEKYYEADIALHSLIVKKAKSKRLIDMLQLLDVQVVRFRKASTESSHRFNASYNEHMEIIHSMREREYERCAAQLERHLQAVMEGFVVALKESNFIS